MFNEKEALQVCQELAKKNYVIVKPVKVELQSGALTFFFLAPKKTDFRGLSRDLNRHFKTKINLQQLTGRRAAALLPGCGKCGRPLCCRTWLKEPPQLSLETAQKLLKIEGSTEDLTGACGKLLCCLVFEMPYEKPAITETRKPPIRSGPTEARKIFMSPRGEQSEPSRNSVLPKPKPKKRFIRRLIGIGK